MPEQNPQRRRRRQLTIEQRKAKELAESLIVNRPGIIPFGLASQTSLQHLEALYLDLGTYFEGQDRGGRDRSAAYLFLQWYRVYGGRSYLNLNESLSVFNNAVRNFAGELFVTRKRGRKPAEADEKAFQFFLRFLKENEFTESSWRGLSKKERRPHWDNFFEAYAVEFPPMRWTPTSKKTWRNKLSRSLRRHMKNKTKSDLDFVSNFRGN